MFKQKLTQVFKISDEKEAMLLFDNNVSLAELYDIGEGIRKSALDLMNKYEKKVEENKKEKEAEKCEEPCEEVNSEKVEE